MASDKRANADVALESWATGLKSSDIPVNKRRSEAKVISVKPRHGGRPREKLSRWKASSYRHLETTVAESHYDFHTAPPAPYRLLRGSTEHTAAMAMAVS